MIYRVLAAAAIAAVSSMAVSPVAHAQTIASYAGTGQPTSSGDGGPAETASIYRPWSLAYDDLGNLFVAELYGSRVRKVARDGTITTVAGNGSFGFSGDGGPAVQASLAYPGRIDVDSSGNLYIADGASRIRKVGTDGVIRTIAGDGSTQYAPDGDALGHPLNFVYALAASDDGTVYFSEGGNFSLSPLIRKITPAGQIVTIVGKYTGLISNDSPAPGRVGAVQSIRLEADGQLLVADETGFVHRIAPDGTVKTLAGGGLYNPGDDGIPALSAKFYAPRDAASGPDGSIYVADRYRVRRIDPDGIIHPFAGQEYRTGYFGDGGPAVDSLLFHPSGVLVDSTGDVLIADDLNHRIRKVVAFTSCSAEGYRGSQFALCRQICEADHQESLIPLIRNYVAMYQEAPPCGR